MNKAILQLSRQLLHERLGLPASVQILDIKADDDFRSDAILVKVQGESLPATVEGCVLPYVTLEEIAKCRRVVPQFVQEHFPR